MTKQNKLDNLIAQALNLQAEIDELKQECQEPTYWEPAHKKEGWYVDGGDINSSHKWNGYYDIAMINRGCVFKTKEEAQQELELQKATYRLKKAIWKANGGFNRGFIYNKVNYYIIYNHSTKNLDYSYFLNKQMQPSWLYIKDEVTAKELIETHKQDFLTYFGIIK